MHKFLCYVNLVQVPLCAGKRHDKISQSNLFELKSAKKLFIYFCQIWILFRNVSFDLLSELSMPMTKSHSTFALALDVFSRKQQIKP